MKETLQNKLKIRRTELGITQNDLADAVKVTRQTIIAIEKGDYSPSLLLAFKIASALRTDINSIFYLSENVNPSEK